MRDFDADRGFKERARYNLKAWMVQQPQGEEENDDGDDVDDVDDAKRQNIYDQRWSCSWRLMDDDDDDG